MTDFSGGVEGKAQEEVKRGESPVDYSVEQITGHGITLFDAPLDFNRSRRDAVTGEGGSRVCIQFGYAA